MGWYGLDAPLILGVRNWKERRGSIVMEGGPLGNFANRQADLSQTKGLSSTRLLSWTAWLRISMRYHKWRAHLGNGLLISTRSFR